MRENCTYGSVRGAPSNGRPYRDRRAFVTLLGSAAAWPVVARAQPAEHVRRIGVLVGLPEHDANMKARLTALRQELDRLGWAEGRTVHIEYRYAPAGARVEELAKELLAVKPDVIVAHTVSVAEALRRETRTIPIVFVSVGDPFGAGFIASLARPGGNLTGLMTFEARIAGRWVAMLKEVAPYLTRAMFLGNPKTTTYDYYLRAADAAATALSLELAPTHIETSSDIERSIADFARGQNSAMVVPPDLTTATYGDLIVALASRHRLPAVYAFSYLVAGGGLMSYGTDRVAEMRQAASYVDRLLRGAAPSDRRGPASIPGGFD